MAQPPPAKKVSDRVHLGFAALAANEKKMAAIRKNAEDSKYFDGSAPKTSKCLTFFLYILRDISYYSAIRCRCSAPRKYFRWLPSVGKRREQVRAYFEAFVKSCYGETDVDQIWNSQMFTARTKQFLEGVTNITQGRFEENIKASTLWGEYTSWGLKAFVLTLTHFLQDTNTASTGGPQYLLKISTSFGKSGTPKWRGTYTSFLSKSPWALAHGRRITWATASSSSSSTTFVTSVTD
jgi:hypothetical protein